jgi:hypothetical protein
MNLDGEQLVLQTLEKGTGVILLISSISIVIFIT